MKISDLDYYATFGDSFLHKASTKHKLIAVFIILVAVLSIKNIYFYLINYIFLLSIILFSNIKKKKVFFASLYPLIFTGIFLFSYKNLSLLFLLSLILKILNLSTTLVILVFTTPYIQIFGELKKFLPKIMVNVMFNAYRALFVINNILVSLITAIKLRGKFDLYRPMQALETFGNLIGFFVIKSIETSEKMYEGIKLRGYQD
jgi:cobalt/nickel transport system permease protein